jgi:hypothetical protein
MAAAVAAFQYRSQSRATTAQRDADAARLLAELVPAADNRYSAALSETLVARELERKPDATISDIFREATVSVPAGLASQRASILALGELGREHSTLRESARVALETIRDGRRELHGHSADIQAVLDAAFERLGLPTDEPPNFGVRDEDDALSDDTKG